MTRNWSINGRFLTQPVTGVQRYGVEILQALDRLVAGGHRMARNLDLEVIVPTSASELPKLEAIRVRSVGLAQGHVWEQAVLPFAVRGGLISLCNTGPLAVRKHIVCVHDVNTRLVPHSYSGAFRTLYRMLIPAIGATAESVSTVSHYSARQIHRLGVAQPRKTVVIGNGHEHVLGWRPVHSEKTRAAAGSSTIVAIGAGAPHKNIGVLLGMANRLADEGFKLALVGAKDLRIFGAGPDASAYRNVHVLGRLTESEIAALLQDSLCLAFPSIVEGFGLPPIEAMALGCPTVVSSRSALPEVCGDASLYAAPTRPEQWLERFVQLRDDPAFRNELIVRGRDRVKLFSWTKSAELYLEAMARSDLVSETTMEDMAALRAVERVS
jgi:glycosyltransferase involved in cell wall biosynthesis